MSASVNYFKALVLEDRVIYIVAADREHAMRLLTQEEHCVLALEELTVEQAAKVTFQWEDEEDLPCGVSPIGTLDQLSHGEWFTADRSAW